MVVPVYFAGIFNILGLLPVGLLLGLVVVEAVGVLGPGGDVDLYAE